VAQVVFTPLLATWSIWVGLAVSTRVSDARVAQQLGFLLTLPPLLVVVLTAVNVIPASTSMAIGSAAVVLLFDGLGWRFVARLFDRERLITGPP
jgi:ABC-2 type transport system permease protein